MARLNIGLTPDDYSMAARSLEDQLALDHPSTAQCHRTCITKARGLVLDTFQSFKPILTMAVLLIKKSKYKGSIKLAARQESLHV